jgi:hypothetical protein
VNLARAQPDLGASLGNQIEPGCIPGAWFTICRQPNAPLSPFEPASSQLIVSAIVYAYFIFRKTILSLKSPSKSILTRKNIKPFPEILYNIKLRAGPVFALFWLLIVVPLELIVIGPLFISFHA